MQKTFDWQAGGEEEETGEAEVSHIVFNCSFLSDQTNEWAQWVYSDVDVLELPEVIHYVEAVDFNYRIIPVYYNLGLIFVVNKPEMSVITPHYTAELFPQFHYVWIYKYEF